MTFLFSLCAFFIFSGTAFPLLAAVPSANVAPPLSSIIAQVVARDESTQKELRTMQYQQATHTEQLDAAGRVTRHQEMQLLVRPGAAQEIQVVSVKGDQIPTDPDAAAQQAKGQETQRRKHDFSLKTLVSRFNISLAGEGDIMGQPAYILAFTPRPNQPYRDQTEKVLDQLHGRMWIGKSSYLILKTEATLAQPVNVAWIFARIATLDFHYELRSTTSHFGPAWIQVLVEVDAPLFSVRQRQTVDMTNFGPRTQVASASKS